MGDQSQNLAEAMKLLAAQMAQMGALLQAQQDATKGRLVETNQRLDTLITRLEMQPMGNPLPPENPAVVVTQTGALNGEGPRANQVYQDFSETPDWQVQRRQYTEQHRQVIPHNRPPFYGYDNDDYEYGRRPPEAGGYGIEPIRGIKLSIPSFQGTNNASAYLDWERTMIMFFQLRSEKINNNWQ
ncbi:unnamed protein product [Linum trigynum]|uniref:Uncharacterized protein n=1 Tax=Linum trigynum TaxID=586398 RepID=A0AAV2ECD5_9ROSI